MMWEEGRSKGRRRLGCCCALLALPVSAFWCAVRVLGRYWRIFVVEIGDGRGGDLLGEVGLFGELLDAE